MLSGKIITNLVRTAGEEPKSTAPEILRVYSYSSQDPNLNFVPFSHNNVNIKKIYFKTKSLKLGQKLLGPVVSAECGTYPARPVSPERTRADSCARPTSANCIFQEMPSFGLSDTGKLEMCWSECPIPNSPSTGSLRWNTSPGAFWVVTDMVPIYLPRGQLDIITEFQATQTLSPLSAQEETTGAVSRNRAGSHGVHEPSHSLSSTLPFLYRKVVHTIETRTWRTFLFDLPFLFPRGDDLPSY